MKFPPVPLKGQCSKAASFQEYKLYPAINNKGTESMFNTEEFFYTTLTLKLNFLKHIKNNLR